MPSETAKSARTWRTLSLKLEGESDGKVMTVSAACKRGERRRERVMKTTHLFARGGLGRWYTKKKITWTAAKATRRSANVEHSSEIHLRADLALCSTQGIACIVRDEVMPVLIVVKMSVLA